MDIFIFPVRLLTVVFSPLTEVAFAASFFAKGYAMLSPLVIVIEEDSNEESDVYCDWNGFYANSASAVLNKWIKPRLKDDAVVHSLRHSMRDRLRAVECPSDMIDQIGGWATAGVGQADGDGYAVDQKWEWLKKTALYRNSNALFR